jgi:O-antigen/teichoic acid export membrane protein
MSRITKSMRNIKYSIVGQMLIIIINFITRLVFVRTLEAEYLGLNGLFTNILSILSLADLGIGTAIVYSMYKPLSEGDEIKLKALMNLYKQVYILIGSFILVSGTMLTPYLDFFIKDMPQMPHIRIIYLMYVVNAGASYFFSYKRSFLVADQKKYIESIYHYSFYLFRSLIQIWVLLLTNNFILYLGVQIFCTIFENIVISNKINKLYPFLKDKNSVELEKKDKNIIFKNVKAMVFHKLGSVIVMSTDNLLISKFIGIIEVGLYSNYMLIINALNQVFSLIFQSMTASIGNLGVTESNKKSSFVFSCIDLFGFWIYAFASICLINLFNPFINLWLGKEYLFPMPIVLLIVISFYFTGRRKSVNTFKDALGLFWYDRYKPLFESGVNLAVSVILANIIGIQGIILGTIISTITTCLWIEPCVLYKYGFKKSVIPYFLKYIKWTMIMIIAGLITLVINELFSDDTFLDFILKMIVSAIVPNVIFFIYFWKSEEFRYLINAFILFFTKRLTN